MSQQITSLAETSGDARSQDLVEIVAEALKAGEMPVSVAQGNLDEGKRLAKEMGEPDGIEVVELESLAKRAVEVRNAFESRVERISSPYVITPELQKTLRVARILKKPLLLEGEPGTGKTSLAYALAGEEDLPIIHCRGKSTLTAQTVMYEIDYVARLNDATLSQAIPEALKGQTARWQEYLEGGGDPTKAEFQAFMGSFENASKLLNMGKVSDVRNYITYGELGEAIIRAAQGEKVILLFDEVDKAKREFPNDLLDELEHMTMRIRETGEEVSAPRENIVVVITSNHERDLPEPFLRRCVYDYLEFPSAEQMTEIVKAHIPNVNDRLLRSASELFYKIRGTEGIQKKPSTSEMLEWMRVLIEFGVRDLSDGDPFPGVLLKTKEDLEIATAVFGGARKADSEPKTDEVLRQKRMPEEVIAVMKGQRVFTLANMPEYYEKETDAALYLTLANAGYSFEKPNGYDSNFTVYADGIRRVGNSFAVTASGGYKVYDLLRETGFVASEFVVTKETIQLAKVEEANEQFIRGTDEHGREVFKTKDGRNIYQLTLEETRGMSDDGTRGQMEDAFYKAIDRQQQRGQKTIRV